MISATQELRLELGSYWVVGKISLPENEASLSQCGGGFKLIGVVGVTGQGRNTLGGAAKKEPVIEHGRDVCIRSI